MIPSNNPQTYNLHRALEDFRDARRKAALEQIMARFTGKRDTLLSFEDVRQKLRATTSGNRKLKEIPLDSIVGSVGRYSDFTRTFLPKQEISRHRWAGVKLAVTDLAGLPPIEVYQIGDVYFVLDGNHRVSVARQLGATHIQAYVTEIRTKVPFSPDDDPDTLILKSEYTEFLLNTGIDVLRPEADLRVSIPGMYKELEEHIRIHQYYRGLEQQRPVSFAEAVEDFYDHVYLPVVQVIRERGILNYFPGRTDADLFLWITEHRAALQESLQMEISPEKAADDLAETQSPRAGKRVARVAGKILDAILPDSLDPGPPPGVWRKEIIEGSSERIMVREILVAISGESVGWQALEQSIVIAHRENSRLNGLHVVREEAQINTPDTQILKEEFDRRCQEAGVRGSLAVTSGAVARQVVERAGWNDLVILSLAHPPGAQPMERLSSGLRAIIQRSSRPIMSVPRGATRLDRPLLAYDGSPKAQEALYISAYIADTWKLPLVVLIAQEEATPVDSILEKARHYLQQFEIQVEYISQEGAPTGLIFETIARLGCDLIVMGGYGRSPVLDVVMGSATDQVLREAEIPVLICR